MDNFVDILLYADAHNLAHLKTVVMDVLVENKDVFTALCMDRKRYWKCDYCPALFRTYVDANVHEDGCIYKLLNNPFKINAPAPAPAPSYSSNASQDFSVGDYGSKKAPSTLDTATASAPVAPPSAFPSMSKTDAKSTFATTPSAPVAPPPVNTQPNLQRTYE